MKPLFSSIAISFLLLANAPISEARSQQSHQLQLAQTNSSVDRANFLNGTWEGSYSCGQGLTTLKLVITARSDKDIDAFFLFSEHPENRGVPSGSFKMKGTLETFNSPDIPDLLDLKGVAWVNQPRNWVMVDLKGEISPSQESIKGNVQSKYANCSTFEVFKQN